MNQDAINPLSHTTPGATPEGLKMTSLTVRHILQVYEEDGVIQVRVAVLETYREGKWPVEAYRKVTYTVEGFLATCFHNTKGLKGMMEEVKEKAAKLDHEYRVDTKVKASHGWSMHWFRPLPQCFPPFSKPDAVEEPPSRLTLSPYPAATECHTDDPSTKSRINIPVSEVNVRVEAKKSSTRDSPLYDRAPGSLSTSSSVSLRTAELWDDSERRVKESSKLSGAYAIAYSGPSFLSVHDEVIWVQRLMATTTGVYANTVLVETQLHNCNTLKHISLAALCHGREAEIRKLIGDAAYDTAWDIHERRIQFPHAIYIG